MRSLFSRCRTLLPLVAALLAAPFAALSPAEAEARERPQGDWHRYCKDVDLRGDWLEADCRTHRGGWRRNTRINFDACPGNEVSVRDGNLVCARGYHGRYDNRRYDNRHYVHNPNGWRDGRWDHERWERDNYHAGPPRHHGGHNPNWNRGHDRDRRDDHRKDARRKDDNRKDWNRGHDKDRRDYDRHRDQGRRDHDRDRGRGRGHDDRDEWWKRGQG